MSMLTDSLLSLPRRLVRQPGTFAAARGGERPAHLARMAG
jgi:hypothetical protein